LKTKVGKSDTNVWCGTKVPVSELLRFNSHLSLKTNFEEAMRKVIDENYCIFCRLRVFFYFFNGTDKFIEWND